MWVCGMCEETHSQPRRRHALAFSYIRLPLFKIICWLFVCFNGNKCWDSIVYDFLSLWVFACVFVHRVQCLLCIHCLSPSASLSLSLSPTHPSPFTWTATLVLHTVSCCRCLAVAYSISALFLPFFTRSSRLNHFRWCICCYEWEAIIFPRYAVDPVHTARCTFIAPHGGSKKRQPTEYDFLPLPFSLYERYELGYELCDRMDHVEVEKVEFIHCWIGLVWQMNRCYCISSATQAANASGRHIAIIRRFGCVRFRFRWHSSASWIRRIKFVVDNSYCEYILIAFIWGRNIFGSSLNYVHHKIDPFGKCFIKLSLLSLLKDLIGACGSANRCTRQS